MVCSLVRFRSTALINESRRMELAKNYQHIRLKEACGGDKFGGNTERITRQGRKGRKSNEKNSL